MERLSLSHCSFHAPFFERDWEEVYILHGALHTPPPLRKSFQHSTAMNLKLPPRCDYEIDLVGRCDHDATEVSCFTTTSKPLCLGSMTVSCL